MGGVVEDNAVEPYRRLEKAGAVSMPTPTESLAFNYTLLTCGVSLEDQPLSALHSLNNIKMPIEGYVLTVEVIGVVQLRYINLNRFNRDVVHPIASSLATNGCNSSFKRSLNRYVPLRPVQPCTTSRVIDDATFIITDEAAFTTPNYLRAKIAS